ncbi:MAG: c-type cytochrome [Candidatus Rariloculaceae bacterium]
MRNLTILVTISVSGLFLLTSSGCSQAPDEPAATTAAPAVDEDSPEFAATEYRQGLMHVLEFKAGPVRNMADGSIPVNEALFAESATDLAAAAGMLTEGFIAGSSSEELPGSSGLPDIWDNWDDFVEKSAALEASATEVATLAAEGGFAAAQAAASELGGNCGGCHRPYRQR